MVWFLSLTTIIGLIAALFRLSWAAVFLAGCVLLVAGVAGLVLSGTGSWAALGEAFAGLVAMQVVFAISGWLLETFRPRAYHVPEHEKPPQ